MRVAVAMSGGVDSTGAALLLREQGHEVLGLHMRLHAYSDETWEHARKVASEIGVEIHLVDLAVEFRKHVIEPFVAEYARGKTPSPCPRCNREMKMGLLFQAALSFGCDKLATGHYARIEPGPCGLVLLKAADRKKDQSYFLSMLTPGMLDRVVFPLGDLTKTFVRNMVAERGITAAVSPESQDLCFIPRGDYKTFLHQEGITDRPGYFVNTERQVLGEHRGITNFTVGQRRGMGICAPEPLYVIKIEADDNLVVVGSREESLVSAMRVERVNVLQSRGISIGESFMVKVRSNARAVRGTVVAYKESSVEIQFDDAQAGVAPGQAAVLYDADRVVAGGWIQ